jgi:hypothetical protein
MKLFATVIFIFSACALFGQTQNLKGFVFDNNGQPVEFATVALLNPTDSTLENFSFSNASGSFEIKQVQPNRYLFQISFVGLSTFDTIISTPLASEEMGLFVLNTDMLMLDTVQVTAERTPIRIKGDTVEYNAAAFKTQPDASAEDLLKKLPGVEVDESGNIKAQGEDVQQVLVDGKEFFSNDPTVATKNLPADAIDKVQVYDKSSDEAEFTGIEDGARSKTINLMLKDGKKSMWLGSAEAGVGTDNRYRINGKAYRFTEQTQIAGLAMLNNVNEFGFSINDYIDFNGGIGAMMSGNGFRIETGDSENMPINFGQQENGLITSGAAGINYTKEVVPGNRTNISYLGSGYRKMLDERIESENFAGDLTYQSLDETDERINNYYHRLNLNMRNKPDSMQSIISTGALSLTYGDQSTNRIFNNYSSDSLTSALESYSLGNSHALNGNLNLTYLNKSVTAWKYSKLVAGVSAKSTLSETQWEQLTHFADPPELLADSSYQDNTNKLLNYNTTFSAVRDLGDHYYLEPSVGAGGAVEIYRRLQGILQDTESPVDSLSPSFSRVNYWLQPQLTVKYSTKSKKWKLSLAAQDMLLGNNLDGEPAPLKNYLYLLPEFSFDKEIKQGRSIRFGYETSVYAPTAIQLLPVTDYINPLMLYTGNSELRPEYSHNAYLFWHLFDQFSFTSLFTRFDVTAITQKINYSRTISPELIESLSLVNTPLDISVQAGADFSTPIRPLKVNLRFTINERFNRGINFINDVENITTAMTHLGSLGFDNRNKDKLDWRAGASLSYTDVGYSIESSQNTYYLKQSLNFDLDYTPFKSLRFSFRADVDNYRTGGFAEPVVIPLLEASVSVFILEANRGTITLSATDLLDSNSGFRQTAAYNYLQTTESNTIGRYALLSFKYRINKTETGGNVKVEVND